MSTVALALTAGVLLLASPAVAGEEPPIVSVSPMDVAGNTVSGTVQPDPEVDVCVSGQHSEADANDQNPIKLNDSSCRAAASGAQGADGAGTGPTSSAGATGGSTRPGASATTRSSGAAGATRAATVNAASAVGLRIAGIRTLTRGVRTRTSFSLVVGLRDMRGNRVQGAIVAVSGVHGTGTPHCGLQADSATSRASPGSSSP